MVAPPLTVRVEDVKGCHRIAIGAGEGVAEAAIRLLVPIAVLWLALYYPGGYFQFDSSLVQEISLFVLAGAILFLLSRLLYRRGFAVLGGLDRRFAVSSFL